MSKFLHDAKDDDNDNALAIAKLRVFSQKTAKLKFVVR